MSISTFERNATIAEMAVEMDRRGSAIERLEAKLARQEDVLKLFVKQWNACGPNSDFGRHFANVRAAAIAALCS
jgi:hypothetical protein